MKRGRERIGRTILMLNIAILLMVAMVILYAEIKIAHTVMPCYEVNLSDECVRAAMSSTYILVILNNAMMAIGVLTNILDVRIAITTLSIIVATSVMASFPSNVEALATIMGKSIDFNSFAKIWFTVWFANFGVGVVHNIMVMLGLAVKMLRQIRVLKQRQEHANQL